MIEYSQELNQLFKSDNITEIDLAYKAYEIIESSGKNAPDILKQFLGHSIPMSKNTSEKTIISEEELKNLIDKVADKVDLNLDRLLGENLGEKTFYNSLWNYIHDTNGLLRTKKAKVAALYWIWMDPRIPYFKLKAGIKMSAKQFNEISKEMDLELAKAKFAVFSTYGQRTEEASVLLDLIEGLDDIKKKTILLAYVIRSVELRSLERILSQDNNSSEES